MCRTTNLEQTKKMWTQVILVCFVASLNLCQEAPAQSGELLSRISSGLMKPQLDEDDDFMAANYAEKDVNARQDKICHDKPHGKCPSG